jgi:hypothetical protein
MRDYDEQRVIAEALAAGIPGRAHLMGIGGVGVAGLARCSRPASGRSTDATRPSIR